MDKPTDQRWNFALQVASVVMIWVFVAAISSWIIHLLRLSHHLHDVPSASIGISIVAIPVYIMGAAVLTFVFVGLQKGRRVPENDVSDKVEEHDS